MIAPDQAFAVFENGLLVLDDAGWRQPAIGDGKVHRAAGEVGPHAQSRRFLDLHIDGLFEPGGEDVMVIGGGGATRQHQFGQGHLNGRS